MSTTEERKQQMAAAGATTGTAAAGGGEAGAGGVGAGGAPAPAVGSSGAMELPAPFAFKTLARGAPDSIPPPTQAEKEDPNTKYTIKTVHGNQFLNPTRAAIQAKLHWYVGIGNDFIINVHPAVNARSARQTAIIGHCLALIKEEFQVNGDWLFQIYDNLRSKLTNSTPYKEIKAELKKEKDKKLRGDQLGSGGASSRGSSGASRSSSGGDSDEDHGAMLSSTVSSLTTMHIGTMAPSTQGGTRVWAPAAAESDATAQQAVLHAASLPKVSARPHLEELNKIVGKQDEKQ